MQEITEEKVKSLIALQPRRKKPLDNLLPSSVASNLFSPKQCLALWPSLG
jgi:hypothetical protein